MELAFNADDLRTRLGQMRDQQQLAFGAACSERLLPSYLAFVSDTGWGDSAPLREALDMVWTFLDGQSSSKESVRQLTTLCEASIPDSDSFSSLYTSLAQDACFSICALLDFLLDSDVGKIVEAATFATDSVDLYVQEIDNMDANGPDLEQQILAHPIMQRELKTQREHIDSIDRATTLAANFLIQLKNVSGKPLWESTQ